MRLMQVAAIRGILAPGCITAVPSALAVESPATRAGRRVGPTRQLHSARFSRFECSLLFKLLKSFIFSFTSLSLLGLRAWDVHAGTWPRSMTSM